MIGGDVSQLDQRAALAADQTQPCHQRNQTNEQPAIEAPGDFSQQEAGDWALPYNGTCGEDCGTPQSQR